MKSKWLQALLYIIAFIIGILLLVYLVAWKSPKYYQVQEQHSNVGNIIPFSKYDSISNHPRPMVIEKPGLIVFGATHTKDPNHPELDLIIEKWQKLKPTIALVEGRLGFLLPGIMDPVSTLGEGGLVKELASQDGVPLYNWDLSKEDLAKHLLGKFSKEQVALQQILNPYFGNMRHGAPADPAGFIEEFLPRASYVGLENQIQSVADVDRLWKQYFPNIDWRNVSDEYTLPGFLSEIMNYTNDLRNQKLVTTINELQKKGERVFVICGSSHSACIQQATM